MRSLFLVLLLIFSIACSAQQSRDTTFRRCPVFITDTVSSNNFFIEGLPATMRVYRVKGELTIQFQQKDQFFTLFFHMKNLKTKKYIIDEGHGKRKEVEVAYSFKSGDQVSYISVSSGRLEVSFDKEKDMWHLVLNGQIRNMVERSVTYYRARLDFYVP